MSTTNGHLDLFIRPADLLLFRDGRPFTPGDDHRAEGLFPPAPVAFYGALRTAALAHYDVRFRSRRLEVPPGTSLELDAQWGVDRNSGRPTNNLGTATIASFTLAHHGPDGLEPLFPMPADVLQLKEGSKAPLADEWVRSTPAAFPGPVHPRSNFPPVHLRFLWQQSDERAWYEHKSDYIKLSDFATYLATGQPPDRFKHPSATEQLEKEEAELLRKPFVTEPRTSVQIKDESQAAEDGMLYTVAFARANQGVGFALRLAYGSTFGTGERWLRLGGEARAAHCKEDSIPTVDPQPILDRILDSESGRFTLVLTTPALFERGWLPDGIGPDGAGTLGSCAVRLVGTALGRFETLGGWDLVRNRPRPARRAVPAGSVYFFEITSGNVRDLFEGPHAIFGRSVVNNPTDRKLGLGLAYLGTW
ncbi:MAG: type III-B CRISPR module-associated protein Cmr3 [Rhodothermales bacterium]